MAPPKMNANIAVNSSGCSVTSKNCSGLRRIFFSARQAMTSVWLTVSAMPLRALVRATTARTSMTSPAARVSDAGAPAIMVLTGPPGAGSRCVLFAGRGPNRRRAR